MKHPIIGRLAVVAGIVLPLTGAYAQSPSETERQLMIENLVESDANSDGELSPGEFEALIRLNAADDLGAAKTIVRSGRYAMAFERADTNGDGVVSQSEIQALAQRLQE